VLTVALLAAFAAYLVWSTSRWRPIRRLVALVAQRSTARSTLVPAGSSTSGSRSVARSPTPGPSVLARALASLALAGGALVVIGGPVGVAAAMAIGIGSPIALARLEPATMRREREAAQRQVPDVAMLLAACLAAGATLRDASAAVRDAVDEPLRGVLSSVVARMDLGSEPGLCWESDTVAGRACADIAAAFERSTRTGAPIRVVLNRVADDLASERARRLEAAARAVGIRAVAPLGLCFLPAFLLIGVVPVVAGFAGALWAS